MKKKQLAPLAGADPIGEFINALPKQASILGTKVHRSAKKSEIYVCYHCDGKKINASLSWKGGAA